MKTNRRNFFAMLAGVPVAATVPPQVGLKLTPTISMPQISAGALVAGTIDVGRIQCFDIHRFIADLNKAGIKTPFQGGFLSQVEVDTRMRKDA